MGLDVFKGLARGLTADVVGAPVDLATQLMNLGLAGYGYAGNKLGVLKPEQMPELIERPVGGSDWFAGDKRSPLADTGSAEYTAGRLTGNIFPLLGGLAGKVPVQPKGQVNAIGWHGTTGEPITQFKPNFRKNEQLGFGIHFADLPNFAKRYAIDPLVARSPTKQPWLYKVNLTYNNPLSANSLAKEGSPQFELGAKLAGKKLFALKDELGIPTIFLQNAIDSTNGVRASRLIQDAGFDAIRYNSRIGELLPGATGLTHVQSSPSTLVFSPEQIQILDQIRLQKGFARGK